MDRALREHWRELLQIWKVDRSLADRCFEEIAQAYASPDRRYHTLEHVKQVLDTVEQLASFARNPGAVKLAAWLHDVIYDSKAWDNEERSAEFARRLCGDLAISDGTLVASLILATKTHRAGDDQDARVLVDADLAILGADIADYQRYAESIRQEYAWVAEAEYREERRRILGSFLIRPTIYHFLGPLEAPARRNLIAEIARLSVP